MNYVLKGLDPADFAPLFAQNDEELKAQRAVRVFADDDGYPCRTRLAHAPVGEELLLLNYTHQPHDSPYFSSGPIYVSKHAREVVTYHNAIPEMLHVRPLSIRGYDSHHMIVDADVCDGVMVESLIVRLLEIPQVEYLHVHLARRGCYACRVDRA
jgi:Protein of unknown function (DUF1203)